jgi:outer membrane biosynthesis protein TonB
MRDPDDQLWRRLLAELDRVEPPWSSPRYLTAKTRPVLWRLTPAALAVAIGGIVALSAYAGSPNPVVWTQHVVTVVHPPEASPTPTPAQRVSNPTPSEPPEQDESPEPSPPPEQHESPQPTQSPEPHESPEPSGEHSGSDSGSTDRGSTSD